MAWIESHQEVGRHPKTKKLARLLGVSLPATVGHLHYLWWWALDFAPEGVLEKYDADDIAEAIEWEGDSEVLLDALIKSGYIDETEDHGLVLHDWGEYAGKLLERRAKDRARKRAAASSAGVPVGIPRSSSGTDAEGAENRGENLVTVTNQPTVTNRNQPTVTNQPQPTPDTPDAPAAEPTPYKAVADLYHEICVSYPRLRNLSESRKKAIAARWKEYGHDLDAFRELFEKAEASPFLKGKNQRNWSADFNWLISSENMAKVLEGKYNAPEPANPQPAAQPRQQQPPGEKFDAMAYLGSVIMAEEGSGPG